MTIHEDLTTQLRTRIDGATPENVPGGILATVRRSLPAIRTATSMVSTSTGV